MRLSATSYYADFVVHPVAAATLIAAAMWKTPVDEWGFLSMTVIAGAAIWPFAEYQIHRWAFHHVPPMKSMHEAHHKDGKALIGTPWWISLPLMALLVLLPAILIAGFLSEGSTAGLMPILITGFPYGAGFTAGLMLGYSSYMIVHHGVHHWRIRPGSYLDRLRRRHELHHRFDNNGEYDVGNYGVVTGFWDKVFRTDVKA